MEAALPTWMAEYVPQNPTLKAAAAVVVLGLLASLLVALLDAARSGGKRPPTVRTLPLIGGLLEFLKGPLQLIDSSYKKYGEVYTLNLLHKRITFLIGPHVSANFFKADDESLSQKEVYEFNIPTFGRGVVFDVDNKVRLEQFRFFADSLKSNRLRMYVGQMVEEAEKYFEGWGDSGEVDLLKELSDLIIMTASRTLLGREVREHLFGRVSLLFHDLDMGMQPISVINPWLPIPAHKRRDKARVELGKIFAKVIKARRDSGVSEPDVLQAFIDAKYKNGRALTDEEITGMLIAVLFAGQHTSSITSTWTGMRLIYNKERCMPPVVEEQRRIMAKHGDKLDYDILQEMDCLHRSVKEALRMNPPLIMLMRYVHKAYDVTTSTGETYHIPKGNIVSVSPTYAHRLPHVFEDPDVFDPDRFAAPREEDRKLPFSYIGFGGGRHGCMGETFAYLQIKTIWSILLRKFDFEFAQDHFPQPDYEAMVTWSM
eukprot:jgi/Pico_ML_1/53323/g3892.t1